MTDVKEKKSGYGRMLLPVLTGFFVMGFCDLVGVSVTYSKEHFGWSETQAGFLPSMVFIWFLIISIPVSVMMGRTGRKKMSLAGFAFTFAAMLLPVISFTPMACYAAFGLLGIGNTILQVSLNPLLSNVVSGDRLSSALTSGQFVKAISSFLGPIVAGACSAWFGNWTLMFPVWGAVTLISGLWLMMTPIPEARAEKTAGMADVVSILKNGKIVALFVGIICIVGIDVGMNVVTPKLLMQNAGLAKETAGLGTSWYFAARTIGTAVGVLLLAKYSDVKYFRVNMIAVAAGLAALAFFSSQYGIIALVCLIAFAASSIFAVLYSMALRTESSKANEISGLMITGVSGGAVIPPVMGVMSDMTGNQTGSIIVIGVCALYLLVCAFVSKDGPSKA